MTIGPSSRALQAVLSLVLGVLVGATSYGQSDTLSALVLKNAGGYELTLDPIFASSTTSYTVSVAHSVNQVTVEVTKTDESATVVYLDGTDVTLSDAATGTTGFQIDLVQGVNTIKVKVTATNASLSNLYHGCDATCRASVGRRLHQQSGRVKYGKRACRRGYLRSNGKVHASHSISNREQRTRVQHHLGEGDSR